MNLIDYRDSFLLKTHCSQEQKKLFPANQHLNQTKRTEAEKSILVLPINIKTKTKGKIWKKINVLSNSNEITLLFNFPAFQKFKSLIFDIQMQSNKHSLGHNLC